MLVVTLCTIGKLLDAQKHQTSADNKMVLKSSLWLVILAVSLIPCFCDDTKNGSTTGAAPTTTTTTEEPATTLSPEEQCASLNTSCEDCVGDSRCMYCYSDNTCMLYPSGKILPPSSYCTLSEARWGTCLVNFEALIISMSVIGGIIILTITFVCIYCCCCRGRKGKKYEKEDTKFESQRMERKARQEERRNERRSRLDEIRLKYGLMKDDSAPYSRFDS